MIRKRLPCSLYSTRERLCVLLHVPQSHQGFRVMIKQFRGDCDQNGKVHPSRATGMSQGPAHFWTANSYPPTPPFPGGSYGNT